MRRFYRKLANRCGYPSLERFLRDCTSEDLSEQIALYRIEPWGEERIELAIAKVGAAICNVLGCSSVTAQDFITDFTEQKPKHETPNDMVKKLQAAGFPVVFGKRED